MASVDGLHDNAPSVTLHGDCGPLRIDRSGNGDMASWHQAAQEQAQLIDLTSLGTQAQGRDLSKQCVCDFLPLRIGTAVDREP